MSGAIRDQRVIALDKACELAENSASIFSDLADLTVDPATATVFRECGESRTQAASELILARQEAGELPAAGNPEKAGLQALGMKLGSLVGEPEAMYQKLYEMDAELSEAVREALRQDISGEVQTALKSLQLLIEETAETLEAAR